MLKFFFGILLVQLITFALFFAVTQAGLDNHQLIPAVVLLELLFTVLMAFWFSSQARQMHQDIIEKMREEHAREREQIKVHAERQKARVVSKSHKELLKQTRRAHAAANFKIGATFAAALAFGSMMIYSQFITFGLLILTTAGGSLAGYLARGKQLALAKKKMLAREEKKLLKNTTSSKLKKS